MKLRPYTPADDAALMALERQCPRGAPTPFVHFRRRFVDRAALFSTHLLLLAEAEAAIVAAVAAGIKQTQVRQRPLRLAYLFDVRVAPTMRRQGLAVTLLAAMEAALRERGCHGAYAHIVATNTPSVRLFSTLGFEPRRPLHYLSYAPRPHIGAAALPVGRRAAHPDPEALARYATYDLFDPDVLPALAPYDPETWQSGAGDARISLYDQSQLFQQVAADAPWPTAEEVARQGRHWRLFHPLGEPAALAALFATLRARAVGENVARLTMLADAAAPLPPFFLSEASTRREYVVVTRPYTDDWDGGFGPRFYCDTREL